MTPEQTAFLNLRHFPGVLNREQAALRSGFAPHEIDILSNAGKLTALGKPKKNCKKVYSAFELERCLQDVEWLNVAQKTITSWWDRKNKSRRLNHNVATPQAPTQSFSRSIQKASTEQVRNPQKDGSNPKRTGKRSGGASSLNGSHDNGHFNNSTSSNE